jgi:XRE family transcriptional regulator, aerobic/anaerobic benzoate catabolism transcriptional regulator
MSTPHFDNEQEQTYLAALGERMREIRSLNGMTRKQLSQSSGLSERYLAQLENGEGNISILLLRRVLQVLNVPISRVLTELDRSQRRNHAVALIGMRGAGKTTLGKALAKTLKRPFIEVDSEIEKEAGADLSEIFALAGPEGYAKYEATVLNRLLTNPDFIIATGGSVVNFPNIYQQLRAQAQVIWLKAQPEDYMQRVIAQGDLRPMSGRPTAMVELRQLLKVRNPLYELAEYTVETSKQTEAQSLQALLAIVGGV